MTEDHGQVTESHGQAMLRLAVRSVALDDRGGFSWLGRAGPRLLASARTWLDDDGVRTHLVNQLTQCLYANFYIRGEPMPWRESPIPESRAARTSFVAELSRANAATGTWYPGRLERVEGEQLVVRYGGLEVYALAAECDIPAGSMPVLGQPIRMRMGRESLRSSPGYYLARGDRDLGTSRTLRWYWHLEPRIAADFVARATRTLGEGGIPYHLKVLADPALYTRCDAGVVYTSRSDAERIAERLGPIARTLAANLRPTTPTFARPIAPGVAVADDPGAGDSFGLDRCRLVAEGLARAAIAGADSVDERLEFVNERFIEAGLDPSRPHLAPGADEPELAAFEEPPRGSARRPARGSTAIEDPPAIAGVAGVAGVARTAVPVADRGPDRDPDRSVHRLGPSADDPLAAAARIGDRIRREAIWYRRRCQWVGAETTFGMGGTPRVVYRSLAPTLYGGTAGIALFLGELSRAIGERALAETSLAAARQALAGLATGPAMDAAGTAAATPRIGAGLYSGATGVTLVAVRLGRILHDDELAERALRLANTLAHRRPGNDGHDLLYGSAGRILGLLALDAAGVAGAAAAAARLGDGLLAAAEPSDGPPAGLSWPTADIARRHNLTGLSHGAAGIAMALLELAGRSGDERFGQAARAAVDYETSWFEPAQGNWPDFRLRPRWRAVRDDAAPTRYSVYWCHGAPGIALQRLRAARLQDEAGPLDDVRRAAATTADSLSTWLRGGDESFSLCHGVLGNAEIIDEAGAALDDPALRSLAAEASREGLRRHGAAGDWPCGTLIGDTPSLLLGRAGIGYHYLRRHDPTAPSVLAFDPAAWF